MGPKQTEGKLDWSVFPLTEAQEVCKAFIAGKKKYGKAFSYREGINPNDLFAAIMRHLEKMQRFGYDSIDEDENEAQCFHIACVAANALMMLSQFTKTPPIDERF